MVGIAWKEEEVECLRELWLNPNVSTNDIAKVLRGRTRSGIEHKAGRLNLGPKRVAPPQIDYEYLRKLQEVVDG